MRSIRAAAVLALAALGAACSSPHYANARASRFDRPYRGGAAAVADDRAQAEEPSTFNLLSWIGAVGLGWTHGLDAPAPSNQPYPPEPAPRPQR